MTRQEQRGHLAFIAIVLGGLVVGLVMTQAATPAATPTAREQYVYQTYDSSAWIPQ